MKQQFILLLLLFPFALMAQNEYSNYNWKTMPDPAVGDSLKSVNGAIILLERRITEVYINSQNLFEEIYLYLLFEHWIARQKQTPQVILTEFCAFYFYFVVKLIFQFTSPFKGSSSRCDPY